MTDANGTKLGAVSQTATLPASSAANTSAANISAANTSAANTSGAKSNAANAALACNVLDLTLGPLNLNLLGNLLCAVAGLLNGGGALRGDLVRQLPAQVLAVLAGAGDQEAARGGHLTSPVSRGPGPRPSCGTRYFTGRLGKPRPGPGPAVPHPYAPRR